MHLTAAHSPAIGNPFMYAGKSNENLKLDVRGLVHHSTIHKENPTRCNNISKFITPYLHEARHVSGDTPPIIRSLKLRRQPPVFHTWKVVGRVADGRCQAVPDNVHQLHGQQPSTYEKPEAAGAVLGS